MIYCCGINNNNYKINKNRLLINYDNTFGINNNNNTTNIYY